MHKQQYTRKLREKLRNSTTTPNSAPIETTTLGIGSININGLDMEATWAAQQLIDRYTLDVSNSILGNHSMCILGSC